MVCLAAANVYYTLHLFLFILYTVIYFADVRKKGGGRLKVFIQFSKQK